MPKGVRCACVTVPVPWHSVQTSGVVPGAQPLPLQVGHCSERSIVMDFSAAEGRLRKLDGKARADALAALRGVGIAPSAAAEAAAEEAAENVAEVAEVEAARAAVAALTRAVVRVDAREAELVILWPSSRGSREPRWPR